MHEGHFYLWHGQEENIFAGRLTEALHVSVEQCRRAKLNSPRSHWSTWAVPRERTQRLCDLLNVTGFHQPYESPQKLVVGANVAAGPIPGRYMVEGKASAPLADMLRRREPTQGFNPSQNCSSPSFNSPLCVSAL